MTATPATAYAHNVAPCNQGADQSRFYRILWMAALSLYGLTGAPTPEIIHIGLVLTGLCLVAMIPPGNLLALLRPGTLRDPVFRAGFVLIAYGMTIPFLGMLISGNALVPALRDIVALAFMLLPLIYAGLDRHIGANWLIGGCVAAGWLFALRVSGPLMTGPLMTGFADIDWPLPVPGRLMYLANSPAVLFAGLWLGGTGLMRLTYSDRPGGVLAGIGYVLLAFVPAVAMMQALQRAGLGVMLAGTAVFLGVVLIHRPRRLWRPVILLFGFAALLWPEFQSSLAQLWAKTLITGLNQRLAEMRAVLELAGQTPWVALFGHGWGATFISPAVGPEPVNYTHNLGSYLLFKTGLCGAFIGLIYLCTCLRHLGRLVWHVPVLAFALAGPLGVHILLYANYKSFGFGLILLVLCAWGQCARDRNDKILHSGRQST